MGRSVFYVDDYPWSDEKCHLDEVIFPNRPFHKKRRMEVEEREIIKYEVKKYENSYARLPKHRHDLFNKCMEIFNNDEQEEGVCHIIEAFQHLVTIEETCQQILTTYPNIVS